MQKSFGKRESPKGFSLVEVMLAVGILGVIGYFVASLFQSSLKNATQSNVSVQAETFKRNLINVISNDGAWSNTIAKNPALNCLAPLYQHPPQPATCSPMTINPPPAGRGIIVQNGGPGGGATVYDNTKTQNGFTSAGAPCPSSSVPSGFNPAGNDQCPFQMNLTVKISCPTGSSCGNPLVEVIGLLSYAPANQAFSVALNTSKYGFDFVRGELAGGVGGSGTANYLAKWAPGLSPSTTLENSAFFQDGSGNIGLGTAGPAEPWTSKMAPTPPRSA